MEQLSYCEKKGCVMCHDVSPTKGEIIGIWDVEGTPLAYVPVKDEDDKEYLISLLEDYECWHCNPPPELKKRIKKYVCHATPEEKAARVTRKTINLN